MYSDPTKKQVEKRKFFLRFDTYIGQRIKHRVPYASRKVCQRNTITLCLGREHFIVEFYSHLNNYVLYYIEL